MDNAGDESTTTTQRIAKLVEILEFLSSGIFVESMVSIRVVHQDDLAQLEERVTKFAQEFIRTTVESDQRLETIVGQKEAIARLSSPIMEIWDSVILVPVIGALDEQRAAAFMPEFLEAIIRAHARVAILDLTGVNASGMETIAPLRGMIQAASLMGCQTVLSGIRPAFAQSMAQSGLDVGSARIAGQLKDALRIAINAVSQNNQRRST